MTKYKKGKIVKGYITGVETYGAFINLDNFYNGLVHISEISNSFVKNINDYVEIGETIYAKVIDVDEKENQVKLSIRDINYRLKDSEKAKNKGIKETGRGFDILEENLENWIKQKRK
jgi:predicted RNA-binding protein with RPS1 domain